VAEYVLIDGYLDAFRTQVRWRRDADDLVAEVEDHLYSTVERFQARGTDGQLAQRQTLERFGDPDLLAEAFASTPRGGIAMPTKFTVRAGTAAVVAAVLWAAAALAATVGHLLETDDLPPYLVFAGLVVGAGAMTLMTTAGLRERHGGLGKLGLAGLIIQAAGVGLSLIATWAVPAWMGLQGAGMLFVALALWPMRIAPRPATGAYGSGMLVGSAAFFVLNAFEVGAPDVYGDHPLASLIGGIIGIAITVAGLLGLGLWLRAEQPAEIGATPDRTITA
jgi:hypothetical protein